MWTLDNRSVLCEHPTRFVVILLQILQAAFKINMKTILVIVTFCLAGVLALTEEQKAKLSEYRNVCTTETGVDPQVVENAKNGNIAENDEKLACFASCMLKKIGIMNQDGSINEEVTRKRAPADVPKDQIDAVINKCKDTTGTNDCDKAVKLVKCFKENKTFSVLN